MSQKKKCEENMGSHSIDCGLYNIYKIFRSDCDELKVEAIYVLASLES